MDISQISKKISMYQAMIAHSATTTVAILMRIIATTSFIVHYPTKWLPYFYIGQSIVSGIVIILTIPLFTQSKKNKLTLVQLGLLICTIIIWWIIKQEWFLAVFVSSLALLIISDFFGIISWHRTKNAFSVRQFTETSINISTAATLSTSLINFILASFRNNLSINKLLYCSIVFMLVSIIFNGLLRQGQYPQRKKIEEKSVFKYPLYRQLFMYGVLIITAYTISDYSLKYYLAKTFNEAHIIIFQLYYVSVLGILCLLMLILYRQIAEYLTVFILLRTLPIYFLLTSLGLIIFPNFLTITILAAGHGILFYSSSIIGREIGLKALPENIANSGRIIINGVATPTGILLGGILIWFFQIKPNVTYIALLIIVIMSFLLFYLRGISSFYLKTLKLAIALKRFDIIDNENTLNNTFYYKHILDQMNTNDIHIVLFCLYLLKNFRLKVIPEQALQHLHSPSVEIRSEVVKLILHFQDKSQLPLLHEHIKNEKDPEVIKIILYTIAKFDDPNAQPLIKKFLQNKNPQIKAAAIHLAIKNGYFENVEYAYEELKKILKSEEAKNREEAAYLLKWLPEEIFAEELKTLIQDNDPNVSIAAIQSSKEIRSMLLAPSLIENLNNNKIFGYCIDALVQYDEAILPLLEKELVNASAIHAARMIAVIAKIENVIAENTLIKIINRKNIFNLNVITKESANRACRHTISSQYRKIVIMQIQAECMLLEQFYALNSETFPVYIQSEILNRKWQATQRLIYWIATISACPNEVIETIPFICPSTHIETTQDYTDQAIEIIKNSVPTHALEKHVFEILTKRNLASIKDKSQILADSWLEKVFQYYQEDKTTQLQKRESNMILMEKVFVLRKTKLFNILSGEILFTIAEQVQVREIIKNEIIFSDGDSGDGLYIIVSGVVNILRNNKIVKKLEKGNLFGELALIDKAPRTASAIAQEEGVLLFIDKNTFEDITYSFPEILWELSILILQYLRTEIDVNKNSTVYASL